MPHIRNAEVRKAPARDAKAAMPSHEKLARNNEKDWSGRGDSNPRLQLGKLPYYPYTTAALRRKFITRCPECDKAWQRSSQRLA